MLRTQVGGSRPFLVCLLVVLYSPLLGLDVNAAVPAPEFPLKISENRRHLVDQKGKPFLYQADTPWMLFTKLTEAEAKEYIGRRKEQGFTALQVMLTGFLGMTNRAGERPFAGVPPEQDFAKLNEKYFGHVDRIVAEAARQGMLLAIAPAWSGCCGEGWAGTEDDGRLKPLNTNGVVKTRELGRWLGNRYGVFNNVMWILGGDMDPYNAREEIRALGRGLKDTACRQLITYHASSSHSSTDMWPSDERWLDVSMVYTYFRGFNKAWNKNQPDVYEVSHAEFAQIPVRPFFLGEATYEGEHEAWGSALQARKNAYWCLLGGGCGHAYGSPNWNFPANWREVLELPGAASLRHCRSLFESRPWWKLLPDVNNVVAVEGRGVFATNDCTITALAADGSFGIAYLPVRRSLTIDMTKLSGEMVNAWWFNPRTGTAIAAGKIAEKKRRPFAPPEDGDWVLVLDDAAQKFPEPGKPTLMAEGAYEAGEEYGFAVTPLWVRRQAYYSYLAGGHHTYGHNDNWRIRPTWKQSLDAPGARQMGVKSFTTPEGWEDALLLLEPASGQAARRWFPLTPDHDDFQDTILDASSWVEAPTGKHGFVTVKADRFVFEDGTPARFWGAQMNQWGKEQTDYAVRRMRRQGINITRLHGLNNLGNDARSFDRLDYLISKLGENGVYIILDLHYPLTHRFRASDNVPGLPEGGVAPYTQFFNDRVAEVMHARMTDIFTHLNPYTRKRYCDDPTLAMVEILNEDSLFWGSIPMPFRTELEDKFAAWLRKKYGGDEGLRKAWAASGKSPLAGGEGLTAGQRIALLRNSDLNENYFRIHPEQKVRAQDQMRFCLEMETKYWDSCRSVMRKAGIKVPIEATNWQGHGLPTRVHMLGQSKLDYVDRHGYWDHPQGEGNLKWRIATALFHNLPMVKAVNADQNIIKYLGVGNLVTEKAWEQILGLPMTISEWNTCLPNEYSLEGTGLMAAYGLLQGWDASLEFGYFSPDWPKALSGGSFDLLGNPPQILQFPPVSVMWHRQDIQEAELVAESLYDAESVFSLVDDRKPAPLAAALVGKVGYRFVDQARQPIVKDISPYWDAGNLVARSITGELTWDARQGFVRINTPRTQAVIGFLSAETHTLNAVSFTSSTRFGALYVTAMDGQIPIRAAQRLLITAVGPARNTGMEYEATTQKSQFPTPFWHLKKEGAAPVLLEAVAGDVKIRSEHAKAFKAWALNVVGKRMKEVPIQVQADAVQLKLSADDETVYYEFSVPSK